MNEQPLPGAAISAIQDYSEREQQLFMMISCLVHMLGGTAQLKNATMQKLIDDKLSLKQDLLEDGSMLLSLIHLKTQ